MKKNELHRFYKNKKVLVTGASGFKGGWLTELLLHWGAKVSDISLRPSTSPNLFTSLRLERRIKHYTADIRDADAMKKIFLKEKPTLVFHLAAQPIVRASYDDPIYTFETNIIGTANILEAIRDVGSVRGAVLITTDKVYENLGSAIPFKESDALGGHDPYSASKAGAEMVISSYAKSFFHSDNLVRHRTFIASARSGNVIGGGDWSPHRLVPDMVRSLFEKHKAVTVRNPKSVRPWQYVLEPTLGYVLLGQKLFNQEKKYAGAWNFGPRAEDHVRVEDLVRQGIALAGRGSYRIQAQKGKHEAKQLRLNSRKAQKLLGWCPVFNIDEALASTLAWYRDFYNGGDMIEVTRRHLDEYLGRIRV